MKEIINNTSVTPEEVKLWRKKGTEEEVPLMVAKYNAKVGTLLEELNDIRYDRINSIDDVNEKIDKLIDILIRGIEFKE